MKQQSSQAMKVSNKTFFDTSFEMHKQMPQEHTGVNMLMEYGFIKDYEILVNPVIVDVEFFIRQRERKIFVTFSQAVGEVCRAKSLTEVFGMHHSFGENAKLLWNKKGDTAMIVLGERPTLVVGEMEWLVNGAFV